MSQFAQEKGEIPQDSHKEPHIYNVLIRLWQSAAGGGDIDDIPIGYE
jgi:hypothetical protein